MTDPDQRIGAERRTAYPTMRNFPASLPHTIHQHGYAVVENVVPASLRATLISAIERHGRIHAIRNLIETVPEVTELITLPDVGRLVATILGPDAIAVRGLLFDKTPRANWKVAWHQDMTIAVREKIETPGFGPWSQKAGIPHVQPPVHVLERMITLRIHLDPCGPDNGPLHVLPGSHRHGHLNADDIVRWRQTHTATTCITDAGGILLMRPLLLHASSPAATPHNRRVIHLEFAADPLPPGLVWHTATPVHAE